MRKEAVATIAQPEQLLQLVQGLAHRARIGIGAKVAILAGARSAIHGQSRKLVLVQLDVGKTLVIAQHTLKRGPVLLDEIEFQQQRLGFRGGDRDLDVADLAHQRFDLGRLLALLEIAAYAIAQAGSLAHIQQGFGRRGFRAVHAIDTGRRGSVLANSRPSKLRGAAPSCSAPQSSEPAQAPVRS